MKFTELNLHPCVMQGIEKAGFTECTPVQEATLEKTLAGMDVYVQSQTGTGKTAAFLITIFNRFLAGAYRHKKALVLTPTRELAVQVEKDAELLGEFCGFKIGCFYGGVGYATQDRLLSGDLNLYIGTPGRLIDYQKSGKIDFLKFEILVIDEADRMFDMGFIPDIRYMIKRMPPPSRRLTMLFSATLSQRVKQLAWEYMNDPVEIEINPEHLTVDLITQELYHIGREEKFNLLVGILRVEQPKSVLVFTNMKRTAERISRRLSANGIINDYISGDLPQQKRLKIIDDIKSGKTEILVATDVAGRGLHIEELDMVINYDLPDDPQNYVHRIGRTARAGKSGKAISLASEEDVYCLEPIEKLIAMKIPVKWAEEGLIATNVAGAPIGDHGRARRQATQRDTRRQKDTHRKRDARRRKTERTDQRQAAPEQARTRQHDSVKSDEKSRTEQGTGVGPKKRPRRRKRNRQEAPARQQMFGRTDSPKGAPKLKKDATPEERLEYYRIKYGENFEKVKTADLTPKSNKPRTLVQSIKGMFGKLKKPEK
jgi:ATP-dependent RNA helicase RhlB